MSYFSQLYSSFRFPTEAEEGFRNCQLGAIHALAAHFTLSTEPAVITMPTGSGKTAVLTAAPFVLQATRALVLTPSRLVRSQIANKLGTLLTMKRIGAFKKDVPTPRVFEVKKRIGNGIEWAELIDYDFVVGTPNSLSPAY